MSKEKKLQAVKGMRDVLPPESLHFEKLMTLIKDSLQSYGYSPIHAPILEPTELFSRSIGDGTDVVEKEMFTFDDFGDSLTMRPEATAGIARSVIQNGLVFGVHKLWTAGPMFRRERPQKGRYRQFNQVSVECYGIAEPEADAEQIAWIAGLWQKLGLLDVVRLEINTLATKEVRDTYRAKLIEYYRAHYEDLDEDSQRRISKNPLRILDSKNPVVQAINQNAPKLVDDLDDTSKSHFNRVLEILDAMGIDYQINPNLVRGLDYYCHTVFEWVTDRLGSQGTICAGGRYDGLTEHIGGKYTPGVGFAVGIERVLLLMEEENKLFPEENTDIYLILSGDHAKKRGLILANSLRNTFADKIILTNLQDISIKSQFKKADQSSASYAIVLGDDEIATNKVQVKSLQTGQQETVNSEDIIDYFIEKFN